MTVFGVLDDRDADRRGSRIVRSYGLWACGVYSERVPSYPVDELYVVIEGTLVVTVDGQQPERFDPGDAFVIERGTACVLDFQSPFRKFWMTYDPQPLASSPEPPTV